MTTAAQLEINGQLDVSFTVENGQVSVFVGSAIAWLTFIDLTTSSQLTVAAPIDLLVRTKEAIIEALAKEEARRAQVAAARAS